MSFTKKAEHARLKRRRHVSTPNPPGQDRESQGPSLSDVRRELKALADPKRAEGMGRYFKTGPGEYGEGDKFLGLSVPQVRQLSRTFRGCSPQVLQEMLASEWHEERLLALLILVAQYGGGSLQERESIFRLYLASTDRINNWDLVDSSAPYIVGRHVPPDSSGKVVRLARSTSVWERRIAILATFEWIRRGYLDPALHIAEVLLKDTHDLIHKAVGWMLREVGKHDQRALEQFLKQHYRSMPRTALRYAIERFPEVLRQQYLKGEIPGVRT